jgi:DNA-binding transcriptional MerR regulator
MKIGELAKKVNCSVQAIRLYEKEGLIPEPERTESGYRVYSDSYIEKINFIRNAKSIGLTLKKIKELFDLSQKETARGINAKLVLKKEIDSLNEKIKTLSSVKNYLEKLDSSCEGSMPLEECPIMNKIQEGDFEN